MLTTDQLKSVLDTYFDAWRERGMRAPEEIVPADMQDGPTEYEGIVKWRVLPSVLTERAVSVMERRLGGKFPPLFRTYLGYGRFLELCELDIWLPGTSSPDHPDDPLHDLADKYVDPHAEMLKIGYVAFGLHENSGNPICFDFEARDSDGDCAIVSFEHEYLYHLDKQQIADRRNVATLAQPLARSVSELFEAMFCGGDLPLAQEYMAWFKEYDSQRRKVD